MVDLHTISFQNGLISVLKIGGPWDTQKVAKKMNLAAYEAIVFEVYLRNPLIYKKSVYHFLHQVLKSFQLENKFFKLKPKISWFCAICWFFNKNSAIEKNPPCWKIQKYFFMDSMFDSCTGVTVSFGPIKKSNFWHCVHPWKKILGWYIHMIVVFSDA